MSAPTSDVLESIERRRGELQQNVDKLRKALSHWTTWEAEYQMLQEEIQAAGDPSPSRMREIARGLDGKLVNEQEMEELLGKNLQTKRSANAVVDLLSKRIDYVQLNSATVEKQLTAAEKQLAGVEVLLEPGMENEEGLPMMDIEEELDEDGNEVSTSVSQTGKNAAEVIEALRKAGLQKAAAAKKKEPADAPAEASTPPMPVVVDDKVEPEPSESNPELSPPLDTGPATSESSPPADNVLHKSKKSALETHGYNVDLAASNFKSGTKVIELDKDNNKVASYPIIPEGESPEDAELRRQMIQYGLSEVGQVVAELDLDYPTVSYSDDDDDYDEDMTEDEEDEDEYGRSTKPVLTEEYRRQMRELEEKLNARMLENVGPQPENHSLAEHVDDLRTMRVQKDDEFDPLLKTAKPSASSAVPESARTKKGVRFADDVEVSKVQRPVAVAPAPTIAEKVVERSPSAPQAPVPKPTPAKVSRFKSARAGSVQSPQDIPPVATPVATVPSGPAGRVLASSISEHEGPRSDPQAPDDWDQTTLNREIHTEYHKARNKFIQQQGGFKRGEDDEGDDVVEDGDGRPKKVSRFMAARMKADGL